MRLATAEQMRQADRTAIDERNIPSVDLMEQAAEGLADLALDSLPPKKAEGKVALLCGAGNNGGDGIAAARLLQKKGVSVRVFLVGKLEKLTPDAQEMNERLTACGVLLVPYNPENWEQQMAIETADVVVDAVFGVGLSRDVTEDSVFGRAIACMNRAQGVVIAADIPSGVEASTGKILNMAVKADKCITFALPKIGHFAGRGGVMTGELKVQDIGIPGDILQNTVCPVQTIESDFVRASIPARDTYGHKGNFGKVLIVGGSVGYTGAPVLAASAAVRSGSGLVFLGVPREIWDVAAVKCSAAMPFPVESENGLLSEQALQNLINKGKNCDALLIGPGLGKSLGVEHVVCSLLQNTEQPVVLDADGLNAVANHMDVLEERRGRVTILTPHDGEFARLNGDLSHGDRVTAARLFAEKYGVILVLKGHNTIVATPQGNVLINTTGNSGLAKGGSGDVLGGMILSLLGQGATPVQAAGAAVWLHGRAGDLCAEQWTEYGMTPADLTGAIPAAIRSVIIE